MVRLGRCGVLVCGAVRRAFGGVVCAAALLLLAATAAQPLWADETPPAFGKTPAAKAKSQPPESSLPAAGLRGAVLPELIRLLGDADYSTRQAAQEEIQRRGFAAYDALSAAANDADLEVASRARYLLHALRSNLAAESDSPKVRELLADYSQASIEQRTALLRRVAELPDLAGTAALCRLLRVERSAELVDAVVANLLTCEPLSPLQRARQAELFRENLDGVQRPAARWLLEYAAVRGGASSELEALTRRTEEIEKQQRRTAGPQAAYPTAALLWYSVAHQYAGRGQAAQAEQCAQRARRLPASTDPQQAYLERLSTALFLSRRGDFPWAESELRLVGASGHREAAGQAMYLLAEMFHDQEKDLEAATLLAGALDQFGVRMGEDEDGDPVGSPRARMYYFYACHHARLGNAAKQQDYLEKAVTADPSEVDTLIASHRLTQMPTAYRKRIARLIEQAAKGLRKRIDAAPENPAAYNQLAWLLGNTHGDLEEAARCARKALELSPGSGTFLDTLAHVYYAKGDYQQAVKVQTTALEQEPNMGPIRRQLGVFRQALQAQGGSPADSLPKAKPTEKPPAKSPAGGMP